MTDITGAVSRRLNIAQHQVAAVIALLDDGATVPFIARYRKERTGSLDELAVRNIETAVAQVRELERRKEFVRAAIAEAGALTPQLEKSLDEADTMTEVEDLYAPYKPKRRTRAEAARELGLEPLAKIIMSGKAGRLAAAAGRFAGKKGVENIGDPPFPVYGNLDAAYPGDLADDVPKILLSHNPMHWVNDIKDSPDKNIALTLSGHTHAMQIAFGRVSPAVFRYPTWGGMYADGDGHILYVNIGTGEVGIPTRIGATPEITLFTLRAR